MQCFSASHAAAIALCIQTQMRTVEIKMVGDAKMINKENQISIDCLNDSFINS